MSLHKAIEYGKEHRSAVRSMSRFRKDNRLFSAKRRVEAAAKLQDDDPGVMYIAEWIYHCCGEYGSCSGQSIK